MYDITIVSTYSTIIYLSLFYKKLSLWLYWKFKVITVNLEFCFENFVLLRYWSKIIYEEIMILSNDDTITSVASPSGVGAISVIRVSGPNSFEAIDSIFKGKKKIAESKTDRTVHEGFETEEQYPYSEGEDDE